MSGRTAILWAHPIVGFAAVGLAVRAAGLGVRSRAAGPVAVRARTAHRRVTPWVLGLMLVSWVGGVLTVWLDRDDLEVGASGHFTVGCAVTALFLLAAAISRSVPTAAWARQVHPWIGAAGVLAAGVQVFLGLQIMPQ